VCVVDDTTERVLVDRVGSSSARLGGDEREGGAPKKDRRGPQERRQRICCEGTRRWQQRREEVSECLVGMRVGGGRERMGVAGRCDVCK